jgi:5-methylcytosine-specific restriction enzyme A
LGRQLYLEKLEKLAEQAPKKACSRVVTVVQITQNIYVAELARRRANGLCQLCDQPAPFLVPEGKSFFDVHHIKWLSKGGHDTLNNTVALCPNCHRKMHTLNLEADRQRLTEVAH